MTDPHASIPVSRPRLRLRTLMAGFALGVVLAAGVALALLVWWHRDATPELSQEAFAAARQRWESVGPDSYDIDLTLSGRQQAEIHVEVREGKVTAMTYNGRSPSRQAAWDAWSVQGQLDAIADELKNATIKEERMKAFGVSDRSQVVLRAEFDAQFGYPRKFYRVVLDPERKASDREIAWQVSRFVPMAAGEAK